MNFLYKITLLCCLLLVTGFSLNAQVIESSVDSTDVHYEADTLQNTPKTFVSTCGYYKFISKDTLYYHINSRDSIVIDYGTPLMKERSELLRVVCDSVGKRNNHFYLQLSLVGCFIKEYEFGSKDTVAHSDSEWLNRKSYLEIDSVGERFGVSYDDSTKLGYTPGGAFAPSLFFNFQRPCADTGVSYNAGIYMDYLVENGLPCPFVRDAFLYTNHGNFDTLGFKTNRLEYVKTAQGSVVYGEGAKKLHVTNIIAAGGVLDIGLEQRIPIHLYQTQEQKLTFHKADDSTMPGMHYTNAMFTLVDYHPYYKHIKKAAAGKTKSRKSRRR